jgi:hypothetical protein
MSPSDREKGAAIRHDLGGDSQTACGRQKALSVELAGKLRRYDDTGRRLAERRARLLFFDRRIHFYSELAVAA